MIVFFLPLGVSSRWDNNELRYLLRSLEENFKEKFRMIIYGDTGFSLDWLVNVQYKELDRYYPEKLLKHYKGNREFENYVSVLDKVYTFVNSSDCPEEFVYIYDDVLLLKKIARNGILNIPECKYSENMYISYMRSKHGRTMNQALTISRGKYRFEHHLPLIYKRDKLLNMFNKYPFQDLYIPYSLATLYFNLYPEEYILPTLIEKTDYKVGFEGFTGGVGCYKQDTIEHIETAAEGKTWLNHNDTGLFWKPTQYPLQEWIKSKFPNKSIFEK
jgi:hypothetical protein